MCEYGLLKSIVRHVNIIITKDTRTITIEKEEVGIDCVCLRTISLKILNKGENVRLLWHKYLNLSELCFVLIYTKKDAILKTFGKTSRQDGDTEE